MGPVGGMAPEKRYRLVVRKVEESGVLWEESAMGATAFAEAKTMAQQLRRMTIDDFLFKEQHRWRMD